MPLLKYTNKTSDQEVITSVDDQNLNTTAYDIQQNLAKDGLVYGSWDNGNEWILLGIEM